MRHDLPQPPEAAASSWHPATTESRTARFILVGVALVFLGLFRLLPLIAVFFEAFRKGPAA